MLARLPGACGGPAYLRVGSIARSGWRNFRVAYTINTRDVEEFRMGAVQDGLEVIAGPYTSSQSSYQMINGHTSSSSSVTITYTLYAAKNGTFNIGASHAIVGVGAWLLAL